MKAYRSEKAGRSIRSSYDALLGQWGVPYTQRDAATRYGGTHVIEAGERNAPPLVLFHGVGDDSALMWLYNAADWAKRFHLYALDTIGGPGKSEMGPKYDKDFDDVTWIDDTLDALGLTKAHMVGVSHGGYLVQLYTLRRPERVDKAVAIASAVPSGEGGSPMKTMMRIFLPEALFPTDKNVEKLLRKLSGAHPEVFTGNPLVMEHYKWLLRGFSPASMSFHKVSGFSDAEIDVIRDRVTYLVGEEDPFEKLGGRRALEEKRMNARFYPDAGHGLNHELAREINRAVTEILLSEGEKA